MSGGRDLKVEEWRVIVRREAAGGQARSRGVILRREAAGVILRREAPKGSLSIQGFYGRGAKAILSLALLAQDDSRRSLCSLRMTARGSRLRMTRAFETSLPASQRQTQAQDRNSKRGARKRERGIAR